MLQSLKNSTPEFAEIVLADLAQQLLPNPFENAINYLDSPLYEKVLIEIRKRTGTKANDNSQEAKRKLLVILSEEINKISLRGKYETFARDGLSEKGILPFKNYKLAYYTAFKPFKILNTGESYIEDAFNNFDRLEFDKTPNSPVVLFSSRVINSTKHDPFVLLVIAERYKSNLFVNCAIRLYYSDIAVIKNFTLTQLLEKFLDQFGLILEYPGRESATFFAFEAFVPGTPEYELGFKVNVPAYTSHYVNRIIITSEVLKVKNCFYTFAINLTKYREYLIGHGVTVGELKE